MLKGLLCGLWTSDHLHWLELHTRIHWLWFLFEHDKATSEVGMFLDLSIIFVSLPLSFNCIIYVLYLFCGFFFVVMQYKVILIVLLHILHLYNVCWFFLVLCFSTIFMPIRIFANVTPKYWHLHTDSLVIFNLLPFVVVIIELVTLELYIWQCFYLCLCNSSWFLFA